MPKFTKEELKLMSELKTILNEVRGPRGGLPKKFRAIEFKLVKLEGRL